MSTTERDDGRIAVGSTSRTVNPALVLAVLATASFIAALDVWITNVGLPAIGRGVGERSLSNLSWVLSAYAIVYAALLVPAGRLADRFGRKGGFLLGLTLFSAASLGAGLCSNIWLLVGFRVLQAAGAAVLTPSSLGLVLTSAPAEKVKKYVSIWITTGALSATCGPLLGGVLITASWRWLFLVNLPVCLLALLGAARWVPNTKHEQNTRLPDAVGGALLILGIGALALGAVEGANWGWSSARVIAAFAVSAFAVAAFVAQSARHPAPVVQLSLLRDRVFSSANGAVLLSFAAFSMVLLSLILWLQGHWHYSAITTGLATAPGPAVVPIFAAIAQNLQQKTKIPVGATAAAGLLLIGLGAIQFAVSLGNTRDYVDAFLPGWLTVGAGAGLAIPTLFSSATVNLAPEQTATGSAIVSMFQQIGAVIGISVLVAILGVASGAASLHLFQTAWIAAAGLAATALIVAFGITPRRVPAGLALAGREADPEPQAQAASG
jgi:EmrB/QacA subfamily drug resistance transporter